MDSNDEVVAVEVFSGTIMEAEMVKSLLENIEIQAYLKDEYQGTMAPWVVSPGGAGSVKVVVSSSDYDQAMSVVNEYNKKND